METTNDDQPSVLNVGRFSKMTGHGNLGSSSNSTGSEGFITACGTIQCDLCDAFFLQEEGGQVTLDTILCPRCMDMLSRMYEEDKKHRERKEGKQ